MVAVATYLFVALGTAMIPNPVIVREIAPTWWSVPVLVVTAALSGLLFATYVRVPGLEPDERTSRRGMAGGMLTFFAVGCPVCNKLVLLALGYSGAITWFAPVQPLLGVGAVVLLAWAVRSRLQGEVACRVRPPVATTAG
ncbi:hypothetical protein GCM10027425_25200 [Alteromonas gracilis]